MNRKKEDKVNVRSFKGLRPVTVCRQVTIDPPDGSVEDVPAEARTGDQHVHRGEAVSRGAMDPERDALYAEFAPLVRRLIRQFGKTSELRRDLPGEIYCRFCALLEAFDPDRGVPLRPYLVRQLTATTYTYARQHWRIASRELELEGSQADTGFGSEEDPTGRWVHAICQQQVAARSEEHT